MTYYNRLFIYLFSTALTLILIHYSDLDLKFQHLFFDEQNKQWLIDKDNQPIKYIFYKLPKYFIIAYGIILLITLITLRINNQKIYLQKKILFLTAALILTPLTVAILKHYSPINCPVHIKEFGGGGLYISPLDIFNNSTFFNNSGKCFPAGHASGGFSLISLFFVIEDKKYKYISLLGSIILGFTMGLYQIAKGAHFLSDTIFTMSIAFLICISLKEIIFSSKKNNKKH